MGKMKVSLGKLQSAGKFRPWFMLPAGNDTVPILVWHFGGFSFTECCSVNLAGKLSTCIGRRKKYNFKRQKKIYGRFLPRDAMHPRY